MESVTQTIEPNPEAVWDAIHGYQKTAALRAAIDLDLFTAISEGAKDVDQIASRCHASNRGIRILCDYLTVSGLLTKTGETYHLTPTSATFLNRHSPACMTSMVNFLNSPQLMAGFANLTETVRQGTTQLGRHDFTAPEFDAWLTFAESMTPLMKEVSEFIAKQAVDDGTPPSTTVL